MKAWQKNYLIIEALFLASILIAVLFRPNFLVWLFLCLPYLCSLIGHEEKILSKRVFAAFLAVNIVVATSINLLISRPGAAG